MFLRNRRIGSGCHPAGVKTPYFMVAFFGPAEAVPLLQSRFLKNALW